MSGHVFPDSSRKAGKWRVASLIAAAAMIWLPASAARGETPHQRSEASLRSTLVTEYRIMKQGDKANDVKVGSETVEKKVFNNNTVVFNIVAVMTYGEGVSMTQHIELVLEEESFFPRTLKVEKTVSQGEKGDFDQEISVEMFSNLAVVRSKLGGKESERRIVVPTGIAITDVGVLGYLYQTLFWYDRKLGGKQRFEYLDPVGVAIQSGEMTVDGEETILVMGKKIKTTVFKLVRDKLGPATLWLDADGVIVQGEQNFFKYELVSKKNS